MNGIKSNNVVNFDKLDIAPFANVDGMLYMVIGSNSEKAKDAFSNAVLGNGNLEYKGLFIRNDRAIVSNYKFEDKDLDHDHYRRKLDTITKNAPFWMPSGYNFEDRTAPIKPDKNGCDYYEALSTTFLKYCVSRIGNPKYHLLFKIPKDYYLNSDFYKNVIASKYKQEE